MERNGTLKSSADAVWLTPRIGKLHWNEIIPLILRHVPTTETLPASEDLAEFTTALIRVVTSVYSLPDPWEGQVRLKFVTPQLIRQNGLHRTYQFTGVVGLPTTVSLVAAINPERDVSQVVIRTREESFRRPCNTTPALLAAIQPSGAFEIEIENGTLRAAAFYRTSL
jgi:hypothetical protein